MPEIAARLKAACAGPFPGSGIVLDQSLGPDVNAPRARSRARDAAAAPAEPSGHNLPRMGLSSSRPMGRLPPPLLPAAFRCIRRPESRYLNCLVLM